MLRWVTTWQVTPFENAVLARLEGRAYATLRSPGSTITEPLLYSSHLVSAAILEHLVVSRKRRCSVMVSHSTGWVSGLSPHRCGMGGQ